MDLQAFFRGRVESALIQASWSDAVRSLLGITGASQVWEERPAWHFWLEGVPGAYHLRLEEWGELPGAQEPWLLGRFAMRFYPASEGFAFAGFSQAERDLVANGLFDPTHHVPRSDRQDEVPGQLFQVGALEIAARPASGGLALCLDALTTARERDTDGTVLRQVPAWDLAFPLFDRLAGLFSHQLRQPPRRVVLRREPGFEWVNGADGECACAEAENVRLTSGILVFGDLEDEPWRDPAAGPAVVDLTLPPGRPPAQSPDGSEGLVNPLWWHLAQGPFHTILSSTCGCADCHGQAAL